MPLKKTLREREGQTDRWGPGQIFRPVAGPVWPDSLIRAIAAMASAAAGGGQERASTFRVRVGSLVFLVREGVNQRWENFLTERRMYDIILEQDSSNRAPVPLEEFYQEDGIVILMERLLHRIRARHLAQRRSRQSLMMLSLLSDDLDYPINTSPGPMFEESEGLILELLSRVAMCLSSRQNIRIDNTFHVHVTIVDGPNPQQERMWIAGGRPRLPTNFDVHSALARRCKNSLIMPDLSETRYKDACLLAAMACHHARIEAQAPNSAISGVWKVLMTQKKNWRRPHWSRKATEALFMAVDHFLTKYRLDPGDFAPARLDNSLRTLAERASVNLSVVSTRGSCLPLFRHPPVPDPSLHSVVILALPQCTVEASGSAPSRRQRRDGEAEAGEEDEGGAAGTPPFLSSEEEEEEEDEENSVTGGSDNLESPSSSSSATAFRLPQPGDAPAYHAALVLNPRSLAPVYKTRSTRCLYCHKSYSKKFAYSHKCVVSQCSTCKRALHCEGHASDCHTAVIKCVRKERGNKGNCRFCRRPVYSVQCLRHHKKFCGKRKKFCERCGKTYDRYSIDREHRCGERFCRICRKYVTAWSSATAGGEAEKKDHSCVMTAPSPPRHAEPLAFFDTETVQDASGAHRVNAVGLSYELRQKPGRFSEIYFYDLAMDHPENERLRHEAYCEDYWPSLQFKPNHRKAPAERKTALSQQVEEQQQQQQHTPAETGSCLARFVDFFFTPRFAHYTLIGHAAARFDSILLLKELLGRGMAVDPLFDGNKALQLRVPHLKIRVIDSYRYIKIPLSQFSKRFPRLQARETQKGTFPFRFNCPENYDYEGALPGEEFYLDRFSSEKAVQSYREEKRRWEGRRDWNFRRELHAYLSQDVRTLREGCLAFSGELYEFQGDLQQDRESDSGASCGIFHPFTSPFFTKSSFVHALWRYFAMPKDTINLATNQRNAIKSSRGEMEWLMFTARSSPECEMRSAFHSAEGQARIGPYRADGVSGNIVYEFNGCLTHYHGALNSGCPISRDFSPCDNNPFGVTMESAARAWQNKKKFLEDRGYTVVVMWECQWEALKRSDNEVKTFLAETLYSRGRRPVERLRLRTGLRGGRTESFRLRFDESRIEGGSRKMYYVDKNSLYPTVAVTKEFPVGPVDVMIGARLDSLAEFRPGSGFFDKTTGEKLEGVVQATVLPPDSLFLPVLPVKVGEKLKFGLCRVCLEEMRRGECPHSDAERALTGVWTTPEIVFAAQCGYTLQRVWEMHVYRRTIPLFGKFYTRLARMKLESEGFPPEAAEDPHLQRQYVERLNRDMPGLGLDPDCVKKNEARRTFAKDLSNSGLGKFSQNDLKPNCQYVSCYEDLHRLAFETPRLKLKHVDPLTEDLAEVGLEPRDDCLGVHKNTQVVIYSFVTAYARIDMMKDIRKLMSMGARIYYTDTDSVIFDCEDEMLDPISEAFNMGSKAYGAYKFETDSRIVRFATLGAKNYAYMTASGKIVVKVRGFVLTNKEAARAVNLDSMWDMLTKFARGERETVSATHFSMRIDRKRQEVRNTSVTKQYSNSVFDKRFIVDPDEDECLSTAPFGIKSFDYADV